MAQDRENTTLRPLPPLPRWLVNPTPVVVAGTTCWLVAAVVLGVRGWLGDGIGLPFWTCAAGFCLGIVGFGIFRWQRWASQRGSRGAWQGFADPEA